MYNWRNLPPRQERELAFHLLQSPLGLHAIFFPGRIGIFDEEKSALEFLLP
jgi:hypothetical protein